jgi:hypothetical protein
LKTGELLEGAAGEEELPLRLEVPEHHQGHHTRHGAPRDRQGPRRA